MNGLVVSGARADDPRPPLPSPGISAPGVDVGCAPTAARPTPVVLLHGTRSDRTINWLYLGPELVSLGFCVYSLDLPDRGQAPVAESVGALARRVQEVLQQTGAGSVSLVGHSLGGIVARDYVLRGGGANVVDDVIVMGTPHTGYYTEPPGDQVDAAFNTSCTSCYEQARGSKYMQGLNAGDLTPGRAAYTSLITTYDGVALPLESQYLPEGPEVANILLQEACPDHVVDHLSLAVDPLVRDWTVDALERRGPADENRPVECTPAP
jgi:triacylglycerol esterase/lipase EstA (alpha/beta hydrolase family)